MTDLEVRELRYFRAVAEELNFSRAAERLGMAQPPLSRAISQLERRLGVQLFERDTRRVALTDAGRTLLTEAAQVLDAVTAAAHRTRRAARAEPVLVATAKPGIASNLLHRIVEAYRAHPDAARVEILVSGYGEQTKLVRTGQADVALIGSPYSDTGLDIEPLVREPRVAALPAGHELADRDVLSRADLAGLPMPQWPDATADERDYWTVRPSAGPLVRDSAQLIEVVALGQAVALVPTSLAERNLRDDVTYRPVHDASPYTIAIAWPAGAHNRWIAQFVRAAIQLTEHREDAHAFAEIA